MSVFLLKRLATFVATLLVASLVVFFVLEVLPGNAAEVLLGPTATAEQIAALTRQLGLDRPPAVRYLDWLGGIAARRPRHQRRLRHAGGRRCSPSGWR